jgi:hypothetical protein
MTVVHEQVHQRTSEQQQVGQSAEQVGTVFRPEVETGDDGENDPDELVAQRHAIVSFVPVRVIVRFIHFDLLEGDRSPKEAGP